MNWPTETADALAWFEHLSRLLQQRLLNATSWPADLPQQDVEKVLLSRLSKSDKTESLIIGQILALSFELGSTKTLYSTISILQAPLQNIGLKKASSHNLIPYIIVLGEVLYVHGSKASSATEVALQNLLLCYHLTNDVYLKSELLLLAVKLLPHCYRLSEASLKDISKIIKSERVYTLEPLLKIPVVELYLTFLNSPVSENLEKYVKDIDYQIKSAIKFFDRTTGLARLKVAALVEKLVGASISNPVIIKRIARLHQDHANPDIQKIIFNSYLKGKIPESLLPLAIVTSYQLKYRSNDRVFGIFEIYQRLISQLGRTVVLQNFGWIFRHFVGIAINSTFVTLDSMSSEKQSKNEARKIRFTLVSLCHTLICDFIGGEMFCDFAKNEAIKVIFNQCIEPLIRIISGTSANISQLDKEIVCKFVTFSLRIAGDLLVAAGKSCVANQSLFYGVLSLITLAPSREPEFGLVTGWILRTFLLHCPALISNTINTLISTISQTLAEFDPGCADFASLDKMFTSCYCLSSILPILKYHKIYVSPSWFASIYHVAAELIKLSSRLIQAIASKEILASLYWRKSCLLTHCGWILMSSLLTMGPDFSKIHSTTLFLFWKSTLSIPSEEIFHKFSSIDDNSYEFWFYNIISKEAGISAMYSFLINNSEICSRDVVKRVLNSLLQITKFLGNLPLDLAHRLEFRDINSSDIHNMTIYASPATHFLLLRKRLFQCYEAVFFHCQYSTSTFQDNHIMLLRMALSCIAGDPNLSSLYRVSNRFDGTSLSELKPTSYVRGHTATTYSRFLDKFTSRSRSNSMSSQRSANHGSRIDLKRIEGLGNIDSLDTIEIMENSTVFCRPDNDPWYSFILIPESDGNMVFQPSSLAPEVSLVDSAIDLFGLLFSLQNSMYQEIIMTQMARSIQNYSELIAKITMNLGEKDEDALRITYNQQLNCAVALIASLRWVQTFSGQKLTCITFDSSGEEVTETITLALQLEIGVAKSFYQICFECLKTSNGHLRALAGEAIGRFARIAAGGDPSQKLANPIALGGVTLSSFIGQKHATDLLKFLTELVLSSSKDPCLRSGACYALSNLVKYVGGISLSSTQLSDLKTIYLRLAEDSNVMVHSWAIFSFQALLEVIGVQLITTGAETVIREIVSSILFILSSNRHRPYWGEHLPFIDNSLGEKVCELHANDVDPYRNIMRALQSLLASFGPELKFGVGSHAADLVMFIINSVRHRLLHQYSSIPEFMAPPDAPTIVPSLSTRYILGPIAKTCPLWNCFSVYAVFCNRTCYSPLLFIQSEILRCFQQYLTFGNGLYFQEDQFFHFLQFFALSSPNCTITSPVQRIAIKLIWQAAAIGWSHSKLEPVELVSRNSCDLAEHLFYIMDAASKLDNIENGNGKSGCLEVEASKVQFSSWATFGKSSLVSGQTISSELEEVHKLMLQSDLKNYANPTKWVVVIQKVLNKEVEYAIMDVVETFSPVQRIEDKSAINPQHAENDKGDNQSDSDIASDNDDADVDDVTSNHNHDDNLSDKQEYEDTEKSEPPIDGKASVTKADTLIGAEVNTAHLPLSSTGSGLSLISFSSEFTKAALSFFSKPSISTQIYALELHDFVLNSSHNFYRVEKNVLWKNHFDLYAARKTGGSQFGNTYSALILRLSDFLKTAFNFGTNSSVEDLRIIGLRLFSSIIRIFGPIEDPDFPQVSILEQYQAQINTGLTLAFSLNSGTKSDAICFEELPESQAIACSVCADYITSGIGADLSSLARVIKILNSLLEMVTSPVSEDRRSFAGIIVRLAVLGAWAEIFINGNGKRYIGEISKDNLSSLSSAWLNCLKECSRMRYVSDVNVGVGLSEETNRDVFAMFTESMYIDFVKAILLPRYEMFVTPFTQATAICLESGIIDIGELPREAAIETYFDILAQNLQFITDQLRHRSNLAIEVSTEQRLSASIQVVCSLFCPSQTLTKMPEIYDDEMIVELLEITEALFHRCKSRDKIVCVEETVRLFRRILGSCFFNAAVEVANQSFPICAVIAVRFFIGICASHDYCSIAALTETAECFVDIIKSFKDINHAGTTSILLEYVLLALSDSVCDDSFSSKLALILKKMTQMISDHLTLGEIELTSKKTFYNFLLGLISSMIDLVCDNIESATREKSIRLLDSTKLKMVHLIVCFITAFNGLKFDLSDGNFRRVCLKMRKLFQKFFNHEHLNLFMIGARALRSFFAISSSLCDDDFMVTILFSDFFPAAAKILVGCTPDNFEDLTRTITVFLGISGGKKLAAVSAVLPLMVKLIIFRNLDSAVRRSVLEYVINLAGMYPEEVKSVMFSIGTIFPAAKKAFEQALLEFNSIPTATYETVNNYNSEIRTSNNETEKPSIQLKLNFE